MKRKNWGKRFLALGLAVVLGISNIIPGVSGSATVQAKDSYENKNLLVNPGFEEERAFEAANGNNHTGN